MKGIIFSKFYLRLPLKVGMKDPGETLDTWLIFIESSKSMPVIWVTRELGLFLDRR